MQHLIERAVWGNQKRHKRLADPTADVLCLAVLTIIFVVAGHLH